MSNPILSAADKLCEAAKLALAAQMTPRSRTSAALREAIEAYESACEADWTELIQAADKACAEQEPQFISLDKLRENGLL